MSTHIKDSQQNMTEIAALEAILVVDLERQYGALIGGKQLMSVLGYPTLAAFRQANCRGTLPVPIFAIAHRKGKFALARDVAQWLATLRLSVINPSQV